MIERNEVLYRFGPFCLDASKRLLLRDGEPLHLPAKTFDTLLALVENRGRVLDKDELIKRVWPDCFVEEINLTVNISALRKVLGETPNDHRYIVTVPRRGYCFVAGVSEINGHNASSTGEEFPETEACIDENHPESLSESRAEQTRRGNFTNVHAFEYILQQFSRSSILVASIIVVLLGAVALLFISKQSNEAQPAEQDKTIAVLPFRMLGAEGEEYLGLGITDALVTKLGNLKQIIVRPTSAVLKYDGAAFDPIDAGRELAAANVLDGKIQKSGDRVRVTVQLLRVRDGASLWADTFDEEFTNLFAVQDLISGRVAELLAVELTGREKELLAKNDTASPGAYRAYLKGRYFLTLRTPHGFKKAVESFEEAVEKDSGYALAYASLADGHTMLGYYGLVPTDTAFDNARASAVKALSLDDGLPEAHASLGSIKFNYEWDFAGAEKAYRKALELNPHHSTAHARYATCLTVLGRFEEAMREIKRARELDPLSIVLAVIEGDILRYSRRYDEALEKYREAIELNPNHFLVHAQMGEAYEQKGMHGEAMAEYEKSLTLGGDPPEIIDALKRAYEAAGMEGYRRKKIELMKASLHENQALYYDLAMTYIKVGEKNLAFELLEKMFEKRQSTLIYLNVDPAYDSLRSDPRFASLLQRMGLGSLNT
ncbi:MAG: tetratricopeptide repeat protein [Blastocatellia bacterium]|nr:tetratricopeptide repeat protein [Blastocatellia bacterium]